MLIRAAVSAAGVVGGSVAASTSGGPDLVGISAVITSIVGALALGWTIYQGMRKASRDAEIAADVIEVLEERRRREGHHDAE